MTNSDEKPMIMGIWGFCSYNAPSHWSALRVLLNCNSCPFIWITFANLVHLWCEVYCLGGFFLFFCFWSFDLHCRNLLRASILALAIYDVWCIWRLSCLPLFRWKEAKSSRRLRRKIKPALQFVSHVSKDLNTKLCIQYIQALYRLEYQVQVP